MIKEDVIRMADEAGFETCNGDGWPNERLLSNIEKFASLVAAHVQQAAPPQVIHAEGCWSWGPAHYACACAEVAKLKGWGDGR
jgi:hypothetical protein